MSLTAGVVQCALKLGKTLGAICADHQINAKWICVHICCYKPMPMRCIKHDMSVVDADTMWPNCAQFSS
eukprot:11600868-Heterocapsa_arctica.AAC.1